MYILLKIELQYLLENSLSDWVLEKLTSRWENNVVVNNIQIETEEMNWIQSQVSVDHCNIRREIIVSVSDPLDFAAICSQANYVVLFDSAFSLNCRPTI
jgi:hypothetical protein